MALLSKLNREMGKTLIVITHNSDIALMADRVIRMRSGADHREIQLMRIR